MLCFKYTQHHHNQDLYRLRIHFLTFSPLFFCSLPLTVHECQLRGLEERHELTQPEPGLNLICQINERRTYLAID